jgi:hypothetical protein
MPVYMDLEWIPRLALNKSPKHSVLLPICCRKKPGKLRKSAENAARKLLKAVKSVFWKKLLIRRLEVRFSTAYFNQVKNLAAMSVL